MTYETTTSSFPPLCNLNDVNLLDIIDQVLDIVEDDGCATKR